MIGFDRRRRWRRHQLFKLRAKLPQSKIDNHFNGLFEIPGFAGERLPHLKFAIRSFLVRRTISMQPHGLTENAFAGSGISARHICAIAQMHGNSLDRSPASRNSTGQAVVFQALSAHLCVGMSIAFPVGQSTKTAVRRGPGRAWPELEEACASVKKPAQSRLRRSACERHIIQSAEGEIPLGLTAERLFGIGGNSHGRAHDNETL